MTLPGPAEWPVENPLGDPSADLLRERANVTPDATAVLDADAGDTWTYATLDERVSRRTARLAARLDAADGRHNPADAQGSLPDGRVGLLAGTRPAFAEVYFATGRLGASVVPLNVELPVETLRDQARRAAVDCLVCESATEPLATDIVPESAPVVSVDPPTRDRVASVALDESMPDSAPASPERALGADRVVMFTSGTTGDPKGVRLTRRNLVASAVGSAFRLGVEPNDRWLVCLPMYHMGGLAPLVRSTLYGTTTVIQRSFDAERAAAALDGYDVTGVSLVPTMLHRLLDAGWHPPGTLRSVLLGGAPASEELLTGALDRGVPVYPTYGTTETASQVATATPQEARDHPGTVGRPLRGTDVSILPAGGGDDTDTDATTPVDPGETGEIVVSGPTVTPGYLDETQTAAAFGPRGFHTGDIGYPDDGRLWVLGRLDDRIHTGGENVHPAAVADALTDLPPVAEAVVVGLPDAEWGERVAALVVAAESGEPPTPGGIRDALRGRVSDYARPKTVAVADELPRTASGTVDREAVRERLADDASSGD
ncbi:2-succinylbenzoate-CoA ligase [Halobacteriales archaeon QS_5_68_33]|nr:MAG: 2-succinylbenzoate-CoA ligase [Halobacteriales archaeon QS_5_68_33]